MKGASIKLFDLYCRIKGVPKEFKPSKASLGFNIAVEKRRIDKNLSGMMRIIEQNKSKEAIYEEGLMQLKDLKNHSNYYVSGRAEGMLKALEEEKNANKLENLRDRIMAYRSEHALGGVREISRIIEENKGNRKLKMNGLEKLRRIALNNPNKEVHDLSISVIRRHIDAEKGRLKRF